MADKYLKLNTSTGMLEQVEASTTSAGAGSAGDVIALGSDGKIDTTMMPAGTSASTVTATATEGLSAGDIVNLHNNAGTKSVRKANATDATKPAHGFVLAAVSSSATATVYLDGQDTQIPVGSYVAADVGKTVFLSTTAGGITTTPPNSTGNLLQALGEIVDVGGSAVTIDFRVGERIIV